MYSVDISMNFDSFFPDYSTIMDLNQRFLEMCRNGILKMDIFSFIEMKFTELSVFYLRIIGVDSGGNQSYWERVINVRSHFDMN